MVELCKKNLVVESVHQLHPLRHRCGGSGGGDADVQGVRTGTSSRVGHAGRGDPRNFYFRGRHLDRGTGEATAKIFQGYVEHF